MFVTVRGIGHLGEDFVLPTCPKFFNIFHPYDPIAYRFETLIDANMEGVAPVLIPHHKGRKRMHIGIYRRCLKDFVEGEQMNCFVL